MLLRSGLRASHRRIEIILTIAAVLSAAVLTPSRRARAADTSGAAVAHEPPRSQTMLPLRPQQRMPIRIQPPGSSRGPLPMHFQTDSDEVGRELNALVREAVAKNPELAAVRAGLSAAQARIPQAGMPKDPEVGFRMKDLPTTFSMVRENATEKQAVFRATYPFPGKLGLKQSIAGKEAQGQAEKVRAAELQLITGVRLAFDDIFVVDKNIQLALEQQRILRDLAEIATSKYRLGPGLQQDVLNADVALARIDTTLTELSRRRRSRLITLGVLLNREQVQVEPLGVPPPADLKRSELELDEMIEATNPQIREAARAVERNELNLKLARRAALPDFTFETEYGMRENHPFSSKYQSPSSYIALNRPDLMTGEVLLSVPVFYWWKQRQQVIEAQAELERSREKLKAARVEARGALRDLLARLDQHERVAREFQTRVIPLARSQVAASISAYQVSAVDFLTLLDAQQKLVDYQAQYWLNRADRYRDLAQIDELTGAPLVESGWNQ
jgi:cobalt-zinc-cadmium efflux system outer membrane protein